MATNKWRSLAQLIEDIKDAGFQRDWTGGKPPEDSKNGWLAKSGDIWIDNSQGAGGKWSIYRYINNSWILTGVYDEQSKSFQANSHEEILASPLAPTEPIESDYWWRIYGNKDWEQFVYLNGAWRDLGYRYNATSGTVYHKDIEKNKQDIANIKVDINNIKNDISTIKTQIASLQSTVNNHTTQINNIINDIADIKDTQDDLKDKIDNLDGRLIVLENKSTSGAGQFYYYREVGYSYPAANSYTIFKIPVSGMTRARIWSYLLVDAEYFKSVCTPSDYRNKTGIKVSAGILPKDGNIWNKILDMAPPDCEPFTLIDEQHTGHLDTRDAYQIVAPKNHLREFSTGLNQKYRIIRAQPNFFAYPTTIEYGEARNTMIRADIYGNDNEVTVGNYIIGDITFEQDCDDYVLWLPLDLYVEYDVYVCISHGSGRKIGGMKVVADLTPMSLETLSKQ